MLKDADPRYFPAVYIVCGYTDLRYGIDSLSAIIERRFHKQLFVPNTLFVQACRVRSFLLAEELSGAPSAFS